MAERSLPARDDVADATHCDGVAKRLLFAARQEAARDKSTDDSDSSLAEDSTGRHGVHLPRTLRPLYCRAVLATPPDMVSAARKTLLSSSDEEDCEPAPRINLFPSSGPLPVPRRNLFPSGEKAGGRFSASVEQKITQVLLHRSVVKQEHSLASPWMQTCMKNPNNRGEVFGIRGSSADCHPTPRRGLSSPSSSSTESESSFPRSVPKRSNSVCVDESWLGSLWRNSFRWRSRVQSLKRAKPKVKRARSPILQALLLPPPFRSPQDAPTMCAQVVGYGRRSTRLKDDSKDEMGTKLAVLSAKFEAVTCENASLKEQHAALKMAMQVSFSCGPT